MAALLPLRIRRNGETVAILRRDEEKGGATIVKDVELKSING